MPSAQRTVGVGVPGRIAPRALRRIPRREASHVSVPRRGDRVPDADDLLALVVPGVEQELGVLGDHALEQSFEDGPLVVHERWQAGSGAARLSA